VESSVAFTALEVAFAINSWVDDFGIY
jgi:hypothetical protein